MSNEEKLVYSLVTLDLRYAEDYRDGFYRFLEEENWTKREEADTAWTKILTIYSNIKDIIAKMLSEELSERFVYFLNNNWKEEYGCLPRNINVSGIMQIGDEGYFSITFKMSKRDNTASVIIISIN